LKLLRNCLIGLASLVLLATLLLWFLPARWALPWLQPRLHGLHLQRVQGSLWDGRADKVVGADGSPLGQLQWQLSRRALFGKPALRLAFEGPQLTFSGDLQRRGDGQIEARGLSARGDPATLDHYLKSPLGQPRGELTLSVDHLLLEGGWPMELLARARWQHALVRTGEGDVRLGTLFLVAKAQGGVIEATWHDDGHGPLQVEGQLQLSPLGWRLDSTLRARHTDPLLRHWLTRLGRASSDGSVHIQYRGGLAGSVPVPRPD